MCGGKSQNFPVIHVYIKSLFSKSALRNNKISLFLSYFRFVAIFIKQIQRIIMCLGCFH